MHFYLFHIGDYRSATAHLSNEEDLAYRRLLDMYYDQDGPIIDDLAWVARRIRMSMDVTEQMLTEMFIQEDDGWHNDRCDRDIESWTRRYFIS